MKGGGEGLLQVPFGFISVRWLIFAVFASVPWWNLCAIFDENVIFFFLLFQSESIAPPGRTLSRGINRA